MSSRRKFLENVSLIGLGSQLNFKTLNKLHINSGDEWEHLKNQFAVSKSEIINFNSGSAGNMPYSVYNAFIKNIEDFNSFAPYEILNKHKNKISHIKERLSELISCQPNEIALTRNTTESINSIVWSLPLKAGDEVIISKCDYPNSVNSIKSRAKRDQLLVKEVVPDLKQSNQEIIETYCKAISPKTKLILLTYITHREGQILPVKEICQYANSVGVEVLLDAAHAFAHIDHDVKDLGCDYYATSLHKWLNAPLGSGMLYIKKEKVGKLVPTNVSPPLEKIGTAEQYDHIGTHDYPRVVAIDAALDFLALTGIKPKQNRLNELKNYWVNSLKNSDSIEMVSDPQRTCAVCAFNFVNKKKTNPIGPYKKEYGIHLKKTGYSNKAFVRVSTNLFMLHSDIDKFIYATKMMAKS